jgi:two-component system cell cycle response regulator
VTSNPGYFKVVIADDSPVYRKLLRETLAHGRFVTFFAQNGREAIQLVSANQPAVLITNWEMPDLTGLELCQQIRSDKGSYTYIILLTSNGDKDQIIEGLDNGADDYLTKPFHAGELLARVAVGCRVTELHRQVQAKNRLLEELALTDPLTGLPNRRALVEWGTRELESAARHGFGFWTVLMDLDNFKRVNDTYGHKAGDAVLKRFSEVLKTSTRASNICGRLGGEEFVLVLSHIGQSEVFIAVERLRQCFEREVFNFNGEVVKVTASFGISGLQLGINPGFDDLLRQADVALYRAKHAGKNRVEFAKSPSAQEITVPGANARI